MEVEQGNGIRIKYDADNWQVISKRGIQDTRNISERKECRTCEHLRKAVVVTESLFDTAPGTSPEPAGVCTLGVVWSVVIAKPPQDRLGCTKPTMGLKDTYSKHTKEEK